MISVALCTYNGEKFLQEQLESIAAQSLLPAEIVICDDGSEDQTIQVVENFSRHSQISVHLYRNEKRMGVMQNFRKTISICKGDYIALCDQDDVWMKGKLKRVIDFFQLSQNKEIQVVFSDLLLTDENLNSLGKTMWQQINFNKKLQKKWMRGGALDILLNRGNLVTGASVVFRSSFRNEIDDALSRPYKIWFHDGLIALMAAKTNSVSFINEATGFYRQHIAQAAGTKIEKPEPIFFSGAKKILKGQTSVAIETEDILNGYCKSRDDLTGLGFKAEQLNRLNKMIKHFEARKNLPANKLKRMPAILKELFTLRYYNYSHSFFLAAVKDLFKK